MRRWIGGTQTAGEGFVKYRAIVFGRSVLASWTENRQGGRDGCLLVLLCFFFLVVAASIITAGFLWMPADVAEPFLSKVSDELERSAVSELTATLILIVFGFDQLLEMPATSSRASRTLERHVAREGATM